MKSSLRNIITSMLLLTATTQLHAVSETSFMESIGATVFSYTQKLEGALLPYWLLFQYEVEMGGTYDPTSALYFAAKDGYVRVVKKLVELGADVDAKIYIHGRTALHEAVQQGHVETVKALVGLGANVNAKAGSRMILHDAMWRNNAEIARALITAGAKVNVPYLNGKLPIHTAIDNDNAEIALLLIKAGSVIPQGVDEEMPILCWAAQRGNPELVQLLLEKGANVNVATTWGFTPLHYAAEGGFEAIVKLLLAKGASVVARDANHRTPHILARLNGYDRAAQLIANVMAQQGIQEEDIEQYIDYQKKLRSKDPSEVMHALNMLHEKVGLEHCFLVGMNNMNFSFTDAIDNVATYISNSKENGYVVNLSEDLLARDDLMVYFSLLINPGAGDSFDQVSEIKAEFMLEDLRPSRMHKMEHIYQKTLQVAEKFKITYLGICSGNQHLILHSKGTLTNLGNKSIQYKVSMREGSYGEYLALTQEEREAYYECKDIGAIEILNPVFAHNYHGVEERIGEGISIEGYSNTDVVQFIHKKGMFFGLQFHSERSYFRTDQVPNRHKQVLDSIFEVAYQRHELFKAAIEEGHEAEDPVLIAELGQFMEALVEKSIRVCD